MRWALLLLLGLVFVPVEPLAASEQVGSRALPALVALLSASEPAERARGRDALLGRLLFDLPP